MIFSRGQADFFAFLKRARLAPVWDADRRLLRQGSHTGTAPGCTAALQLKQLAVNYCWLQAKGTKSSVHPASKSASDLPQALLLGLGSWRDRGRAQDPSAVAPSALGTDCTRGRQSSGHQSLFKFWEVDWNRIFTCRDKKLIKLLILMCGSGDRGLRELDALPRASFVHWCARHTCLQSQQISWGKESRPEGLVTTIFLC